MTAFAVGLELFVDGAWADITPDLSDDGVTISRGRANEGQQVDPARMSCRLRNNDGRYSPRNPRSPLFGLIGRNTPIRFWEETGQPRLVQDAEAQWHCPDSSGLSITGDIDLRVDIAPRTWRPEVGTVLGLVKGGAYWLWLDPDGRVSIEWNNGTIDKGIKSSVPVPGGITGRKAIRVAFDVDNGSGTAAATFYDSDHLAGTWAQFGAVVELGATTVLNDSTSTLGTYCALANELFGLEVRQGIGGTVRASVDWTAVTSGVTTYTDGQSNVWTPSGSAEVTSRHYRFVGEVTAWPQRWGLKGAPSAYAPIECAGVLRRLGQGSSPVQSALRRGCAALSNLVGYWPMEEPEGAKSFQAVVGRQPGRIIGPVDVAAFSGFDATDHLPALGTGRIYCAVSPYLESGEAQIRWLSSVPQAGLTADVVMLRVRTSSTLGWVDVHYATGGGWYVKAYTSLGVLSYTTSTLSSSFNDLDMRLSLELKQNGSGVDFTLVSVEAGQGFGFTLTENKAGITLGRVTSVDFNPDGVDLGQFAVGHLTVEKRISTIFDLTDQFAAYVGERADTRMLRLADENALSLAVIGAGAGCERMGAQRIDDLVTLLRDAATSDGGVLFEPRTDNALRYRSLESLWAQDPAVSIAYTDNLLQPFEPVDDDDATRNKVTVTRRAGGSFTVQDSTGPLGTMAPPDGVGIYDESVSLSLATDAAAEQQAGWRLHLGTVDEARWPQIGLDLAHPTFLADPALTRQILTLDVGDRLDVTDLPAWLPPFPVRQIVQGYSETITPPTESERGRSSTGPPFHHKITFNCTPARPYTVGTYVASGYSSATTGVPGTASSVLMSDDGTGKTNGTVLDTAKWTSSSTGTGGAATYQSTALKIASGTAGGYAGASRVTRRANITSPTNVDISGTWTPDANEPFGMAFVRATLDAAGDPTNGYIVFMDKTGSLQVGKQVSSSYTQLGSTISFSASSNTTYGFRLRAKGTAIKARIWSGSEGSISPEEPTYPWSVQVTDSSVSSSGFVGLSVRAGNAATQHAITFDDVVVSAADGTASSTSTSITPIDAGPSDTRFASSGSELNADLAISATSAAVKVTEGPQWTTAAGDLPLDLLIGGEQVTCTAIGAPSSGVQTFTLTRAVNGISKAHAAGAAVDLLDPSYWGARPLGGTLFTGGGDTGGGTPPPDTNVPNTVRIGSSTYPLSGIDPGLTGGWGGDAGYPGNRGVDQLIVYTRANVTTTATNQYGIECPTDSDLIVNSQNDRQASQSLTGTSVPAGGYVASGHGAARDWLLAHATVGALIELIYVAAGGGGTGGGTGGGGTGGGTIGAYPSKVISLYKMIFPDSEAAPLGGLNAACNEVRLAFANGTPLALVGYGPEGATSLRSALATWRAAGKRVVLSIGGAGYTVSLSNPSAFISQFQAIATDLGGLDGIDWDIESSAMNSNAVTVSTGLKSIYGPNFAITMAPNGGNVGVYLPIAVQLHQANALENYGQQFYDAQVSLAAARGRVSEAINAGIPASKISVGMMNPPGSVPNGYWDNATCVTNMTDIRNTYGVHKAYLWWAARTGASTWVSNMDSIL